LNLDQSKIQTKDAGDNRDGNEEDAREKVTLVEESEKDVERITSV
jgi:hypothetical protein